MPRGYRGVIFAVVGLAPLSGGIWYGLTQQSAYYQEAQRRHADYASHAAYQIPRTCIEPGPLQRAQCLKKAVDEYRLKARDNQRDYADLVAQQTSALWTGIMGVAALIGMGLSAVGVALVWTTFRETKRTNQIAMRESARATRRAMSGAAEGAAALAIAQRNADAAGELARISAQTAQRQLRPYVGVEGVFISGTEGVRARDKFVVSFKNYGQTPALNVSIKYMLTLARKSEGMTNVAWRFVKKRPRLTLPPSQVMHNDAPYSEEELETFWLRESDPIIGYCKAIVSYSDLDGTRFMTTFILSAEPAQTKAGLGGVLSETRELKRYQDPKN